MALNGVSLPLVASVLTLQKNSRYTSECSLRDQTNVFFLRLYTIPHSLSWTWGVLLNHAPSPRPTKPAPAGRTWSGGPPGVG